MAKENKQVDMVGNIQIEERAEGWATFNHTRVAFDTRLRKEGYIQGATEQKKIDIEKACDWLKANADKYIVDIGIMDEKLIIGDMCWADFRKAMEE